MLNEGWNMDRLNRFNYFMVTALLSLTGFEFKQEIYSGIEIWHNPKANKWFEITQISGCLSEESLLNVLDQAGLTADEFLKLS